jgi:integrase
MNGSDTTPDQTFPRARGGRPKGSKGHHNDGLQKRCGCPRRQWAKCSHPWYFNFGYRGKGVRLSLNKHANKPLGYWMPKSEAETLRDTIRAAVRAGTFCEAPQPLAAPTNSLTVEDVTQRYLDSVRADPARRPQRLRTLLAQLALICRTVIPGARGSLVRVGDLPVADVVVGHLDAFRDARRAWLKQKEAERQVRVRRLTDARQEAKALPRGQRGRHMEEARRSAPRVSPEVPHRRGGETGCNRHLELLRLVFNFAIRKGYRERENPFLRHGQRVVQFAREQGRHRRLLPEEVARLLAEAGPHLQSLIVAALESGCRRGELLSLRWRDILVDARGGFQTISLRAENTKTDTARRVPISPRLRAVLEMRGTGPDGKPLGPDAFVFGDESGRRVGEFKMAWYGTLRRAGIRDLTFHDLRHEFGSRLIEAGVSLLTVSHLYGHKSIATTARYLNASETVVEREMASFHRIQERQNPGVQPDEHADGAVRQEPRETLVTM